MNLKMKIHVCQIGGSLFAVLLTMSGLSQARGGCHELSQTELEAALPALVTNLQAEKATQQDFATFISNAHAGGVIKIDAQGILPNLPKRADVLASMGEAQRRYGQEDRPIFAKPIAGTLGEPGGVLIFSEGETVGKRDFSNFLGPPHVHRGVHHLTIVTNGEGLFYAVRKTPLGDQTLIEVPVKAGEAIIIPADTIHTFWAGTSGPFDVASFTSSLIRTDSPAFQEVVPTEQVLAMPVMTFSDYYKLPID